MKKQKKIAGWLKGLCVALAIMFAVFFGAITWFIFKSGMWFSEDSHHVLAFFTWYVGIISYIVLLQFWKVCSEIEKDNSFSLENAGHFHTMAIMGGAVGGGYVVRIICELCLGITGIGPMLYAGAMICLSMVFVIICECLSQLINNAYEIKKENEFTI